MLKGMMNNGSKRASRDDIPLPKGAFAVCSVGKAAAHVALSHNSIDRVTLGHKQTNCTRADQSPSTNCTSISRTSTDRIPTDRAN
ncbi:MAG: hypothetical protein IIW79_02465 [Clostridia bacterium]|nr:hypothetical protein [Clostridia bacterium]